MFDTLRVLVTWDCNRRCGYCCNAKPEFSQQFRQAKLGDLDFSQYQTVCISGGEPLMYLGRVMDVCRCIPKGKTVVLYTNGDLLTRFKARTLEAIGVQHLNVGLHRPSEFRKLIFRVRRAVAGTTLHVRFHVFEGLRGSVPPGPEYRFWKMDDCNRPNEDRVVLC